MSPRLKLRAAATPLVMAGALWASSGLPIALGGGAQTPPPCGPDGICVPSTATFGHHGTRWRPFPGDVIGKPPTAATTEPREQETLGGPKLPTPAEEAQSGPARAPRGGGNAPGERPAEGADGEEDAAAAGLGTLPGEVPLPGIEVPGIGQPALPEGGEAPANGPGAAPADPGAAPGADPLDPFGSAPPAPPAWLRNAAMTRSPVNSASLAPLPTVTTANAAVDATLNAKAAAAEFIMPGTPEPTVMDGPNLHGDDAPPMLPPALQGGISSTQPARRVAPPQAVVAPAIAQPASVARANVAPAPALPPVAKTASVEANFDDDVIVVSAEEPVGIHLVNPAEALVDPEAQGLQQAIYFEASDQ